MKAGNCSIELTGHCLAEPLSLCQVIIYTAVLGTIAACLVIAITG